MRRIALISDIHGNALALDAVLAELDGERLDGLVCLGDVASGPQPRESLDRVRALDCPVVMGNWDAWCLAPTPPAGDETERKLLEIADFWAAQLSDDDLAYIRTFVPRLELPLHDGVTVGCFHGSPRSYDDFIFATTPDEQLAGLLGDLQTPVLAGGHTHIQLLRRFEQALFVNPGSVGLAFSTFWPHPIRYAPWAEYAVLAFDEGRAQVDLRRTSFPLDPLLELVAGSGMPHAQWWIDTWERDARSYPAHRASRR